VHAAARDWRACAGLRPAVVALLNYAEKLTASPHACRASDVQELRDHGWSDGQIHDAVQAAAYFNYINRVADALGVDPEPGIRAWGAADEDGRHPA